MKRLRFRVLANDNRAGFHLCDLTLGACQLTGGPSAVSVPSRSSQFIGLLADVMLIMGGPAYFSSVALGPVTEQVSMDRGIHYPAR
jgi:hypothetical protein